MALLCLLPTLADAQGIEFVRAANWNAIKEKAMAENKYIFVDAYATWCGPCKKMDAEVYPDAAVGQLMNDKFVAVKIQFDQTAKDDAFTRGWYADAKALNDSFKIAGYPSFLFFSPDGQLIHRDIGYKTAEEMVTLAKFALAPARLAYRADMDKYNRGVRDYAVMPSLIKTTRDTYGNRKLASAMAADYKENYLDKLAEHEMMSKDHWQFVAEYSSMINSRDRFFAAMYRHPERVDSILDRKGIAMAIVTATVEREELENKLVKNDKGVKRLPDFTQLQKRIAKKYPKVDAKRLVTAYKVKYYWFRYKDWPLWAKAKDDMLKRYPPSTANTFYIYTEYNTYGAWEAFLRCDDSAVLTKSLEWIDTAIALVPDQEKSAYVDTKASVLYKLARVSEAIATEEWAVRLAEKQPKASKEYVDGLKKILQRMKDRQPIYEEEGIVWNEKILARIKSK